MILHVLKTSVQGMLIRKVAKAELKATNTVTLIPKTPLPPASAIAKETNINKNSVSGMK